MRPIQVLSPQVANQIAAGEVVERPASIVKELVENSIDAGASQITLEVTEGGKDLLVVRDNGSGIPREQLDLALAPHATSKLKQISDLEDLISYGFRGEALASISSVSKLSLISRVADAESGWKIYNEGKEYRTSSSPVAHPVGTSIEVAELFYNTPARRKFLKSSTVEYNHIEDLIKRMAIVRPQIDWTVSHNGRQKLRLRGLAPDDYKERILQIFPQHFSDHALQIQAQVDTFNLKLEFVVETDRYFGIKSSSVQYSYINNRLVKDKVIISAMKQVLMELFGHTQLSYVLFINLDPQMLDVNVHPSKTEVRFVDSHKVHSFVFQNIFVQLATLLHREQNQIEAILKARAEDETLLDQTRLQQLQAKVQEQELQSTQNSNLAIDNPSLRSNLALQLELEAQGQGASKADFKAALKSNSVLSGSAFALERENRLDPTASVNPILAQAEEQGASSSYSSESKSSQNHHGYPSNQGGNFPKSFSKSFAKGSGSGSLIDRFRNKTYVKPATADNDEIAGLKATIALFKQDFTNKKNQALGLNGDTDSVMGVTRTNEANLASESSSPDLTNLGTLTTEESFAILDELASQQGFASQAAEGDFYLRLEQTRDNNLESGSEQCLAQETAQGSLETSSSSSVVAEATTLENSLTSLTERDIHNIYQSNNFSGAELSLVEEQELAGLPAESILKQEEIASKFGFKSDHYLDKITKQQVQLELLQNLGEVSRNFHGTPLNRLLGKESEAEGDLDPPADSNRPDASLANSDDLLTSSLPPTLAAKLDKQFGLGELAENVLDNDPDFTANSANAEQAVNSRSRLPTALAKQFNLSPTALEARVDNLIACVEMLARLRNKKAAEQNLEVQLSRKISAELETVVLNPAIVNLVDLDLARLMPLLAQVFRKELNLAKFSAELNTLVTSEKYLLPSNSLAWLETATQARLQVLTAQQQQSLVQVAQKIYLIPNKLLVQSLASFISEQMLAYGQLYLSLVADSESASEFTLVSKISAELRESLAQLEYEQWQALLANLAGLETYFAEQESKFADPNLFQASILLLEQLGLFSEPAQLLKFLVPIAQEIL